MILALFVVQAICISLVSVLRGRPLVFWFLLNMFLISLQRVFFGVTVESNSVVFEFILKRELLVTDNDTSPGACQFLFPLLHPLVLRAIGQYHLGVGHTLSLDNDFIETLRLGELLNDPSPV